jgi:asparagine synthetase B (glutamine-hydrolysing)
MAKWIIHNLTTKIEKEESFDLKLKIGEFNVLIDTDHDSQHYTSESFDEGIYIFGYLIPRLAKSNMKTDIHTLFLELKANGAKALNAYKGNFVIIVFFNNQLHVFNDHFGINKYFYYHLQDKFIASSSLHHISSNVSLKLSKKNILKYFVFNYFIGGITIYENCFNSSPASSHTLTNDICYKEYFSINDFIDERKVVYSKSESVRMASNLWKEIIKDYLNKFSGKRISQTLTAGMDSRLILAGFRANNYNPSTFTFGRGDSLDVIHAKKIASRLKLKHDHLFPEPEFFENYSNDAEKIITISSGMSSVFRAHRFDAYRKMKDNYDVLFFGFIGSETIRGIYPDGLTVPKIVTDFWLNGQISLRDYYPNEWFQFDDETITEIEEEIYNLDFIDRPDIFLFKMMIPLHFAQDIGLNEFLGVLSVAPFWDIDFLEFQKNTPFFTDVKRKEEFARSGHYNRRKGPYFSANLIFNLDKENAKLSLGKGYSPADYKRSLIYASLRFIFYKTLYKERYKVPNFNYETWFHNYIKETISTGKFDFVDTNKEQILNAFNNNKGETEAHLISFVKLINVELISKL